MSREFRRGLLLTLAFLALGLCLLLAGERVRLEGGVSRIRVDVGPGGGTLYLPGSVSGETAAPAPDEDGHVHGSPAAASGGGPTVLVLSGGADGAELLASELGRRGVAVLVPDRAADAAACWEWLLSQPFVLPSAAGLAAGPSRGRDALALAGALAGSGREPAAVMLLGDRALLPEAGTAPARNLLFLLRSGAGEELTAFYGSESAAQRGFEGYFSQGTARALRRVGAGENLIGKRALAGIIDWQGSSLGHRVEIPDDDLAVRTTLFCRAGAGAALLLAAGMLPLERRRKKQNG